MIQEKFWVNLKFEEGQSSLSHLQVMPLLEPSWSKIFKAFLEVHLDSINLKIGEKFWFELLLMLSDHQLF